LKGSVGHLVLKGMLRMDKIVSSALSIAKNAILILVFNADLQLYFMMADV
jgi:hypothetical protein